MDIKLQVINTHRFDSIVYTAEIDYLPLFKNYISEYIREIDYAINDYWLNPSPVQLELLDIEYENDEIDNIEDLIIELVLTNDYSTKKLNYQWKLTEGIAPFIEFINSNYDKIEELFDENHRYMPLLINITGETSDGGGCVIDRYKITDPECFDWKIETRLKIEEENIEFSRFKTLRIRVSYVDYSIIEPTKEAVWNYFQEHKEEMLNYMEEGQDYDPF